MPSGASSNGITTYEALQPPKRQRKFLERRCSIKPKAAVPRLRKDQSTLTQLDFIAPTSSRTESMDTSSDHDFEERRPKKKRRKSKFDEKGAGQSTLTQFDRDFKARRTEEFEVDEDGFQIWQEPDTENIIHHIKDRHHNGRRTLPWLRDTAQEVENKDPSPEIPETSQIVAEASTGTITKATAAQIGTAESKLQTPRKVRFQEVPSSQTPPSTMESIKSLQKRDEAERSPLKERSANFQSASASAKLSPESQNISIKMLERVRFATRKVPFNDTVDRPQSETNATAADEPKHAIPDPPTEILHSLARTNTIQDSQSEHAGQSSLSSAEAATQPKRKLQRVSTVQDSQFDDEDVLSDPNRFADSNRDGVDLIEESQFPEQDEELFDPANSALDRDALRFGWTQTQHRLSDIAEEDEDEETDDDDLDRGCARNVADRSAILASHRTYDDLRQLRDATMQHAREPEGLLSHAKPSGIFQIKRPDSRDDSAYESGDHANRGEIQVLSSSSPLRPSQISTVVPTQASLPDAHLRRDYQPRLSQNPAHVDSYSFPISPHKPLQHFDLSSSPFPLPPWSSPEKVHITEGGLEGEGSPVRSSQLARLVDYSLPPPPPLSSNRGQTPASSST